MDEQQENEIVKQALQKEWGVELADVFSEQEITERLALMLATVVEKGPEAFFRLMYRLDIPEKQLQKAMYDKEAIMKIAKLVYIRQLQKLRSRQHYKRGNNPDSELNW